MIPLSLKPFSNLEDVVVEYKGDNCVNTHEAAKYDAIDLRMSLSATMESSKPGVSIRVTGTPST